MQDAGNFNYRAMINDGIKQIGGLDLEKGEKVFVTRGDDGRSYEFISSSSLKEKDATDRLAYVKVPDAVMKDILKQARTDYKFMSNNRSKTAVEMAKTSKRIVDKITLSRGKFTSFKSAISIFTRFKSQMKYNKLSAERKASGHDFSKSTKTEKKIQEKLFAKIEDQEKVKSFVDQKLKPLKMTNKQIEKLDKMGKLGYFETDYKNNQVKFATNLSKLAKKNTSFLKDMSNGDRKLSIDDISSLQRLVATLELGKSINNADQQVLESHTQLFSQQSEQLKNLINLPIDIDGLFTSNLFEEIQSGNSEITLGEYLEDTGLKQIIDMMQFFVPRASGKGSPVRTDMYVSVLTTALNKKNVFNGAYLLSMLKLVESDRDRYLPDASSDNPLTGRSSKDLLQLTKELKDEVIKDGKEPTLEEVCDKFGFKI